jgi:formylglycine-generating enzyme required for sulfatase activity
MMHRNSLRVAILVFVCLAALLLPACTTPNNLAKSGFGAGNQADTKPSAERVLTDLPSFLAPVPGGPVEVGLEANQLVNAACQVISPDKPENAAKIGGENLVKAMRRSVSVLGHRRVEVPTFLLAKFPVTNGQYVRLVDARRKAGIAMRAPFHWWRYGCKVDYEAKLADKAFPNKVNAALLYWERYGGTLPYKLLDEEGHAIDDQPVVFVTWREANDFAGSIGMRLPLEVEWTRAARGDGKQIWPLLEPEQAFTAKLLGLLRMTATKDKNTKPVGTTEDAVGPFGHMDMFGQVWQFVGDTGYRPINGNDAFAAEWRALQEDETGQMLRSPPVWTDDRIVAKGGSFLSGIEPIQLLIDARGPLQTTDALESVGFRLAKSLKPGYDALFSALRGTFGRTAFAPEDVDLTNQIGAERYELDNTGFPAAFETVTFAPVNWLSREKNADFAKLVDQSETAPMLIGVLLTTGKLAEPAADAGLFSVLWRHAGVPKELTDAVKQGAKDLAAAAKKGDVEPAEKKPWREVIARFGLADKDLESKDAAEGHVKFVRLDTLEVPTEDDCFVLLAQDGKPIAPWKARAKPAAGGATPSAIALGANAAKKMTAKINVSVPIEQGKPKRTADFQIEVALDRDPATADKPWRLPAAR